MKYRFIFFDLETTGTFPQKDKIIEIPSIKVTPPGPKSVGFHSKASEYMKGYSGQVRLFPIVFKSGWGYSLTDVDGNVYLDFSSGIYVTGCGHSHPINR